MESTISRIEKEIVKLEAGKIEKTVEARIRFLSHAKALRECNEPGETRGMIERIYQQLISGYKS